MTFGQAGKTSTSWRGFPLKKNYSFFKVVLKKEEEKRRQQKEEEEEEKEEGVTEKFVLAFFQKGRYKRH